jgi:perosamine synthetase
MITPLFRPYIRRRDMNSVLSCMVSDKIGTGEKNRDFSKLFTSYIRSQGTFLFSSYFNAIYFAFSQLDINPGDKVIISPLAPLLYLSVFNLLKIRPVFIDVDLTTGLILIEEMEKAIISEKPRAVIVYYTQGFIPELNRILREGLTFIEDITQGLGGLYEENKIGSFGTLTLADLNSSGLITCGEGGMISFQNRTLYRKLKKESFLKSLFLSDLNASLGISQLKKLDYFVQKRREIAEFFYSSLRKTKHKPLIQNTTNSSNCKNVPYSFPVVLESGLNDALIYAQKHNINIQPAFHDSIISSFEEDISCPNARSLYLRCVLFPLYPSLSRKEIKTISRVISTLP